VLRHGPGHDRRRRETSGGEALGFTAASLPVPIALFPAAVSLTVAAVGRGHSIAIPERGTNVTGSLARRATAVLWAAVLALLVTGVASFVWGGLLVANLTISPAIPWAVVVMAAVLWLLWQYLGGRWWPRGTSVRRRALLRWKPVPRTVLGWALLAGALSLVALVGLWIVLVELTHVGGNPTIPGAKTTPAVTLALALLMASLVSSLTEEWAFRGYAQVTLERAFGGVAAVTISSLFFMLDHGPTQGFAWSKLLFYFLVGAAFGTIAFLTTSTLPAWPAHLVGDLTFFFLIWPNDATRRFVWRDGADATFWLAIALAVVFVALAVLAFLRLFRATRATRATRT
jgi:membrane protease YdiL (CAAX protease family)